MIPIIDVGMTLLVLVNLVQNNICSQKYPKRFIYGPKLKLLRKGSKLLDISKLGLVSNLDGKILQDWFNIVGSDTSPNCGK